MKPTERREKTDKHRCRLQAHIIFSPNFIANHKPDIKLTLSKPWSSSFLPRTSPMPDRAVTGLSPMGSATKSLCFWEVVDIPRLFTPQVLLLYICCSRKRDGKMEWNWRSIREASSPHLEGRYYKELRTTWNSQIINLILAIGNISCFVCFGHFRHKFGLFKRLLYDYRSLSGIILQVIFSTVSTGAFRASRERCWIDTI